MRLLSISAFNLSRPSHFQNHRSIHPTALRNGCPLPSKGTTDQGSRKVAFCRFGSPLPQGALGIRRNELNRQERASLSAVRGWSNRAVMSEHSRTYEPLDTDSGRDGNS
jgi:hypothetical protein